MRLTAIAIASLMFLAQPAMAQEKQDHLTRPDGLKTAVFSGGSFLMLERAFDDIDGVIKTINGFSGGTTENPDYYSVENGGTGHREAVEVLYDPKKISYGDLVEKYFRSIDPTDAGGQFCDRGERFTSAVFYNTEQERVAAASKKLQAEDDLGEAVMTRIIAYKNFYPAEGYQQDYHLHDNKRYKFYRGRCGIDKGLQELWGWKAHIPEEVEQ